MGLHRGVTDFLSYRSLVRDQHQAGAGRRIIEVGKKLFEVGGFERIDVLGDHKPLRGHERKGLAKVHDLRGRRVAAVDRIEVEVPGRPVHDLGDDQVDRLLDQELLLAVKAGRREGVSPA